MLAITLARQDFREFDQLITLYTLEQGKMEVVARGIKKNIAKNAPALEPFSLIEVELAPGRELTYVTKATIVEQYATIRTRFPTMLVGAAALSRLQHLIGGGEKDSALFHLIISFLQFLNHTDQASTVLLDSFTIRLLKALGFVPVLDRCVRCEKKRRAATRYIFAVNHGGILCSDCRKVEVNETLLPLSAAALTLFEQLQQAEWLKLVQVRSEVKTIKMVEKVLQRFIAFHTNQAVSVAHLATVLAI